MGDDDTPGDWSVVLCGAGGSEPCNDPYAIKRCPMCGAKTWVGYGLAYGGCGTYVACVRCDWVAKQQDGEGRDG